MVKNILFLAHSNNDIDFYLPLVSGLKRAGAFEPIILFVRPRKMIKIAISAVLLRILNQISFSG